MSHQQLEVSIGGCSRKGVKEKNQDAFAAHLPEGQERDLKGAIAVMCDGVSSCENSEIASQTAVTNFSNDYYSTPPNWSVQRAATRVLQGLNNWLYRQNASQHGAQDNMLTTMTAVVLKSQTLHCFHAGDSRLYRLRGSDLELITTDHVRIERGHEFLARAIGADPFIQVDYVARELEAGDVFLLTSDGLHGWLSEEKLKAFLKEAANTQDSSLESISTNMVESALSAGSDDNVSALILRVDNVPAETLDEAYRRLTQLPIPPVLKVGQSIDDYEVEDVIFSGTRSHMYLVRDRNSGERYVLKAPSLNFTEDAIYLDGFIREEWVGQRISHPNVMKTFAPPRPKKFLYYLGEYITGQNMREWIQDNPSPPLDIVRKLVKQMVAGIRAFNRADMVHQDLKPENIMIDGNGLVRILDFGTVLIAGTDEIASPLDKSVPQGSVNYVAPEYLIGAKGTIQSDLYSLAVIVYEMLTDKLPYKERPTKQATINRYSDLKYIPARNTRPDIPVWLEAALHKGLQANPEHRYNALSEFEHDINIPNRDLTTRESGKPLLERHPVKVWKAIAGASILGNIALLFKILGQ